MRRISKVAVALAAATAAGLDENAHAGREPVEDVPPPRDQRPCSAPQGPVTLRGDHKAKDHGEPR